MYSLGTFEIGIGDLPSPCFPQLPTSPCLHKDCMLFRTYYGEKVLYGWLVFLCILQTVQAVLVPDHLFKDICSVFVQPWKTDSSAFLSTRWNALSRLKTEAPKAPMVWKHTPLTVQVLPGLLCPPDTESTHILATSNVVSNEVIFSYSEIFSLMPASMKLWQANLLPSCKVGNIWDLPQFLTPINQNSCL